MTSLGANGGGGGTCASAGARQLSLPGVQEGLARVERAPSLLQPRGDLINAPQGVEHPQRRRQACPPKASCVGAAVEVEGAAAPGPRASVVLLLPAGHPEASLSLPAATLAPPLTLASAAGAAAADAPEAAL